MAFNISIFENCLYVPKHDICTFNNLQTVHVYFMTNKLNQCLAPISQSTPNIAGNPQVTQASTIV